MIPASLSRDDASAWLSFTPERGLFSLPLDASGPAEAETVRRSNVEMMVDYIGRWSVVICYFLMRLGTPYRSGWH